jgi:hypothetical protein
MPLASPSIGLTSAPEGPGKIRRAVTGHDQALSAGHSVAFPREHAASPRQHLPMSAEGLAGPHEFLMPDNFRFPDAALTGTHNRRLIEY